MDTTKWATGLVVPAVGYVVSCVFLSIIDEPELQVVCWLSALFCVSFVFCVLYFWRDWQIPHSECVYNCRKKQEEQITTETNCIKEKKASKEDIQGCFQPCVRDARLKLQDCAQINKCKGRGEDCMKTNCQQFFTELGKCYSACRNDCSAKYQPWIRKHRLTAFLLFFLAFILPCALAAYRIANQVV